MEVARGNVWLKWVALLLSVMLLLQGYLGIGFPAQPGKMAPADAIIGSVDDATGAVQVRTLQHVEGRSLDTILRLLNSTTSRRCCIAPGSITFLGA